MSNAILPQLPGIGWGRSRASRWSTTVRTASSGREYRAANWSYPVYEYQLDYDVLRQRWGDTEYAQLVGFINSRGGSFDSFLYFDAADGATTGQTFGTGDAVRTQWQLVREFGGYVEPVLGIVEPPAIYASGSPISGVSVTASGLVTFASPPAYGAVLTWAGPFYWRCRFMRDRGEFSEMVSGLHELRGLSFVTTKL